MKVALIHYRLIHFGGLETRLKNYISYFVKRGDEVTVICAKYDPDIQLPEGVKLVKLSPGLALKPYRQRAFDRKLGKYMQQNQFDLSLSLGRTSHQDMVLCPGNHKGYLEALLKKNISTSDRIQIEGDEAAFANSRLILAASGMMKDEVHQLYGIPQEKINVLYPPLNTEKYPPVQPEEKEAARMALELEDEVTYFLFVSLGHGRKGLSLLLNVFGKMEDSSKHLLIIGGPEVKTGLPNVSFLGYFENPREVYLAADFLVHPSVYEPYGQIVAEALQCETPVIISNKTGAHELVSPGEGKVLSSLDPNLWLTTLNEVQRGDFHISPNFAGERRITLEDHMQQMLKYAGVTK